ncbi:MAG: endonuclease MutS2, partial [Epsilonproteobacteria bacterium]|nr:endonuclease MutS2 [Campylobacterota bacterium]
AFIECNGIKMQVPLIELKKISKNKIKVSQRANILVQRPKSANVTLDLHGLRSEEAIEKLDKYLSDALITGYDEVLIYHGVGTGRLAYAVKNFLKTHPKVKEFFDAPANMGGMGATIVRL